MMTNIGTLSQIYGSTFYYAYILMAMCRQRFMMRHARG